MTIALLSILVAFSVSYLSDAVGESRYQETLEEMRAIRDALVGDPQAAMRGGASSGIGATAGSAAGGSGSYRFGYAGDMGGLPSVASISDLVGALLVAPGGSSWQANAVVRFGLGWNGPYLIKKSDSDDFTLDAWGSDYLYDFSGEPVILKSLGANLELGGTGLDSDLSLDIPSALIKGTVHGVILNGGAPWSGLAQIEINYPDGDGVLVSPTVVFDMDTDHGGAFSFDDIPLGMRSVKIYVPSIAAPTQTVGPAVFTMDRANFVIPPRLLDLTP